MTLRDATHTKTLHLTQVSSRFDLTWGEFYTDLEDAVASEPHAIGFTEVGGRPRLEAALKRLGYATFNPAHGDGAIAVRMDGLQILRRNNVQVTPASEGIRAQYLTSVVARWGDERVWLGEAHWLVPRSPERWSRHVAMTRAMVRSVQENAKGRDLAFFLGDLNVDPDDERGTDQVQPYRLFNHHNMTTIWDELGRYPGTHGRRTIDVIGSYDRDRRVVGHRAYVRNQNADHDRADAWYQVDA